MGKRRARRRERDEMPLGNPSVFSSPSTPLMSCPFNPPPLSRSLFFLFSSPFSPISNANFLHFAIPETWGCYFASVFCQLCLWWSTCLLCLCLSLHRSPLQQACNFLMSSPPLPPLLAPLSIIAPQSLRVVSLFITSQHCVVSQQYSQTPGAIKYRCPDICMQINIYSHSLFLPLKGWFTQTAEIHIL